ncbi:hypothetical protein FKP32DRAFT_675987 [Trametes sanguinea]|nr:hypothetical protein FKP32DRAFT_675987 [Trametes sanguinea]
MGAFIWYVAASTSITQSIGHRTSEFLQERLLSQVWSLGAYSIPVCPSSGHFSRNRWTFPDIPMLWAQYSYLSSTQRV